MQGVALDCEFNPDGTWGITDGSAGLRGSVLRSDSLAEVKEFVSSFLSGMAIGLQQTRSTVYGMDVPGTTRNSLLTGTGQMFNRYADEVREAIRKDGVFVRVPAGKPLYVFIPQTIDRSQAKIGNLRPDHMVAAFHNASETNTMNR